MKIILVAVMVTFGMNGISFAMSGCGMDSMSDSGQASAQDAEKGSSATNVGNKICLVGGDPVDGKTTYEYKGKVYNFCCPMCIPDFKKNPEKYIAKMEQAASSENSMPEGHQHGQ
jgi:YHS domain-containing protein